VIWAYGIAERPAPVDGLVGLDDAPLEWVEAPHLCAAVTRHATIEPGAVRERMLRHEAVVEALMELGPVLPMRFGTTFSDDEPLRRTLRERGGEFHWALGRVRGRVEMAVSVPQEEEMPASPPAGGSEYLLAKVERRRRAAEHARRLEEALAPLVVDSRVRVEPGAGFAVKAAYLVERDRAAELERRAAGVDGAVCTGPWPPYTFAGPA